MAQVSVQIDGKAFRMACEDGQEAHLETLAAELDSRIKLARASFGEIGDLRLTVMAALMLCDDLSETRKAVQQAQTRLDEEKQGENSRDLAVAQAMDLLTARVERMAQHLAPKAFGETR